MLSARPSISVIPRWLWCRNWKDAAPVSRRRHNFSTSNARRASESCKVVIGIETSFDQTGVSVVTSDGRVLAECVRSTYNAKYQHIHKGVVPHIAADEHLLNIDTAVDEAMRQSGLEMNQIDAVAVTVGPGLALCLNVGMHTAKCLAASYKLPLIPVNHLEAHALVARMCEPVEFPYLVLLISGGHTQLLLCKGVGSYRQLGGTADDAVGECYDKVARLLGLELTRGGGPELEELAANGDSRAFEFVIPMRRNSQSRAMNLSFSGIKSAVTRVVQQEGLPTLASAPILSADLAASFQACAVLHLTDKLRLAMDWCRLNCPAVSSLVVTGGVACNQYVRAALTQLAAEKRFSIVIPPPRLCTDNGTMVAWAGQELFAHGLAMTVTHDSPLHFFPHMPLHQQHDSATGLWRALGGEWQPYATSPRLPPVTLLERLDAGHRSRRTIRL